MGLFPTRLYVISVLVGIVEMALAGLAAGYVYKEEPAAA
jgi:hypothetical protein